MPSEASAVSLPRPSGEVRVAAGTQWIGATVRIAVTAWSVYSLLFAAAVYWEVRSHGHSPARIFLFVFLVWYAWAAFTPFVAWLGNRFRRYRCRGRPPLFTEARHSSSACSTAPGGLRSTSGSGRSMRWAYRSSGLGLLKSLDGRLFFEVLVYMTVLGTSHAVESHHRLREREMRAVQLEASLTQARLHALELQIQPHFLFNTLHAIGGSSARIVGPTPLP